MLAAVTLLPALIALLGHRVSEPGKIIGRLRRKREPKPGPGFWERWTATLMKRPLPFALGATALMLLIAAPALSLKENTAAIAMFPEDFETRVGFDLAAQAARRRARWARSSVLADFGRAAVDQRGRRRATPRPSQTLPGVEAVAAPVLSRDGRKALIVITPREAPESDVHDRAGRPPARDRRPGRRAAARRRRDRPEPGRHRASSPARCGRSRCS